MATQKRKAERWTYHPRPTGDRSSSTDRGGWGPHSQSQHMPRIEFAASHRPSRNNPAMDPVRGSDRTSPSKSGRPRRQLPLRMPYATPFLLTNAHSPWHLQFPLCALVLCQRPAAPLCPARGPPIGISAACPCAPADWSNPFEGGPPSFTGSHDRPPGYAESGTRSPRSPV